MRAAILLSAVTIAACTADGAESAGGGAGTAQRSFEVPAFDSVALSASPDVIVRKGERISVRAEGDPDALDALDIRVDGGTLHIDQKRKRSGGFFGFGSGRTTIHVTAPTLTGASVAGSGNIDIDTVETDSFGASISGSGNVDIGTLQARDARFRIAGSGNIRAAGAAEKVGLHIAGSGDIDAGGLESRTASVSIAGSGNARAHASDSADISIVGSGDVTLSGSAKCKVSKMGSGSAHCGA